MSDMRECGKISKPRMSRHARFWGTSLGFCIFLLRIYLYFLRQVQLYRKSHNYGRALDLDFHYFIANEADRNVKVHIVWGLKPRDMSICHFSDGRCEGREQYDDEFDPNTQEAQLAMKVKSRF